MLPVGNYNEYLLKMFMISRFTKQEKDLLENFCLLPSKYIDYRNKTRENLLYLLCKNDEITNYTFPKTLNHLVKKGWLLREGFAYKIHQVIQDLLLVTIKPTLTNNKLLLQKIIKCIDYKEKENPYERFNYIIYSDKYCENVDGFDIDLLELRKKNAWIKTELGNHKLAYKTSIQTLSLLQKFVNIDQQTDISSKLFDDLAWIFYKNGKTEKGISFQEKAIEIKKEHLNGKSLENSYHQLSQIYNEIGEPQIALKYAKMVLSILNKSEEKNPFLEITAYRSIGNAYRRLNKYEKALIFNKRSCELAEKIFDKGHIKTAYSYAGLAINYINIGDNSNSLIYSKKAKKILLRNFDEMHPDVATCYNNIARAYLNQNRKKMALRYQLKANKSIKNKNFPNTRKGLFCNNLALIYNSLNELDKAYIQQLKAIRYDEKYISSKSILIFKTYYNMVNILIKMGKKNKALTFVEKARNSLTEEMNEEFELLNSLVIDLGRS